MRVVIDTNVIISSLIVPDGTPGKLIDYVKSSSETDIILSEPLLAEYRRASSYPKVLQSIRRTADEVARALDDLQRFALLVGEIPETALVESDPDDNIVVATALAGAADCVVSGDRHLLQLGVVQDIPIVTPAAFLILVLR